MALVISHKILHEKTGRAIVCPMTSFPSRDYTIQEFQLLFDQELK